MFVSRLNSFLSNVTTRLYKGGFLIIVIAFGYGKKCKFTDKVMRIKIIEF